MSLKDHKIQAIILYGPPGSGKGLLGDTLAKTGEFYHFSSGDMFRNLSPESDLGQKFYKYSSRGFLLPDDLTMNQFKLYIHGLIETNQFDPHRQKLLIDGIPRTEAQAKALSSLLDVIAFINLKLGDKDELYRRIKHRATIEKRLDDHNLETFKRKMQTFTNEEVRILSSYSNRIIHNIDAQKMPLEVLKEFLCKTK